MAYGKASFTHRGLRAAFFTNVLDGTADNLLTRDPQGRPIAFDFETNTYDFEISNVQAFAARHVFNYGGNLRFNKFDLSLAPQGDDRTEFGIYAQDEIFLSDHFRWVIGARVDRFDFIDDLVFSPRTSFLIKPRENHTIRLSYNRAYRSPSVINNFLNVTIAEPINLGLFSPLLAGRIYPLPVVSVGNADLQETSLDAYEAAYTGAVGRTTLSLAFFANRSKNDILFTELRDQRYTPRNPPPGWPLPPAVIGLVPGGSFPARFTYLNFGEVTQRGIEVGADTVVRNLNLFANYSWQDEPDPEGFDISELNIPAAHRFNLGLGFNSRRFLGNLSVSYSDGAFWQDVLDDRFHGTTDAYTLVNGGFGIRWGSRDEVTTSIKLMNLANEDVQQHVFGDIVKRQLVGEIRVQF
jgi:outer membrane receptor protein involved in Fe transport